MQRQADSTVPSSAPETSPESRKSLNLTSDQMSWIRTDLSNLRTLLSWLRTSVSMIGFGFTIYNFYSGFFDGLSTPRVQDAARNLGLALVGFGTLAMVFAVWNYWTINRYLESSTVALAVPRGLKLRWAFSYLAAAVVFAIGLITFLFMLRVI